MRRVLSVSVLSLSLGLAVALLSGCARMHEYDDVIRNRNACNPCEGSPWREIRELNSRCNPCDRAGACGCAPAKAPCAPACAPKASPKSCATVDSYPAGAKPGEAWCRVVVPAKYETIREPVQTVCASVKQDWVPPVTKIELHRELVVPACDDVIHTPGASRLDVLCAEGCPARTETRTVCVNGPCGPEKHCETCTIPATTSTTRREVCIHPPGRHEVHSPAEYLENPCLVEVTPGHWVDRPVAPVVEMRTRVVCVSPERVEWRRNPTCEVPVIPSCSPCAPAAKK